MLKFGYINDYFVMCKVKKGRLRGIETKSNSLLFGSFGLKSMTSKRLKLEQFDCIKKSIEKKMHKTGKIWFRCFPRLSVTSKPSETRMGKGKGNTTYWCFPIKAGRILVEFYGVTNILALQIVKLINKKLPFSLKLIFFYD